MPSQHRYYIDKADWPADFQILDRDRRACILDDADQKTHLENPSMGEEKLLWTT
jgi:hypothetical protein